MLHARSLVMAAAAALLVGCNSNPFATDADGSFTVEPGAEYLRTGVDSYTLTPDWLGWTTEIDLTFTNPLPQTIYVVNCHGGLNLHLQRREGGEWNTVWQPVLLMCLSPPIRIAPGATFSTTYRVWGAEPDRSAAPAFTTAELDGTYRFVWGSLVLNYDDRGSSFGDPVPLELRISNAFQLTQQR